MTGFLKRDLYLSIPFFRLYGVFLALALFLTARSGLLGRTYLLYIMVLGTVGVQNLFNFDRVNAWSSYAAAVPGGRRALVDAHYLTALGLAGAQALTELFIGWRLGWTGLLHTGFFLLILALMLPAACRFGPRQPAVSVPGRPPWRSSWSWGWPSSGRWRPWPGRTWLWAVIRAGSWPSWAMPCPRQDWSCWPCPGPCPAASRQKGTGRPPIS